MTAKWKKPLILTVSKTETFKTIVQKLSEEVNHAYKKISIHFDGEPLNLKHSQIDEDFEGGEQIDCTLL